MWLTLSLIGNVLLLAILLNRRWRRYQKYGKWPITKAAPEDIDPIFKPGPMGPSKETGIHFIGNYRVPGGISDFETWVICNLAKKAGTVFEFGTCTGKTAWLLAANAPQATIGDEVTVLDSDPLSPASVYRIAELAGTIPYEIFCRIGPRVRRVAVDEFGLRGEKPQAIEQLEEE